MKNVKCALSIIALTLSISNVHALSYECEINGQTVYQSRPCEGVAYPEHLTNGSRYGGTNISLTDLLAARGAAAENLRNAQDRLARHNRRLQAEQTDNARESAKQATRGHHSKKAAESRQYEAFDKKPGINYSEVYNRSRANEYESAARNIAPAQ